MSVSICYQCATLLHWEMRPQGSSPSVSWDRDPVQGLSSRRWMYDRWLTDGMIWCGLFDGAAFCYFILLQSVSCIVLSRVSWWILTLTSRRICLMLMSHFVLSLVCLFWGFMFYLDPYWDGNCKLAKATNVVVCGITLCYIHTGPYANKHYKWISIFQWDMYKGDEFTISVECLNLMQGPISECLCLCVWEEAEKNGKKL